MVMDMDFQEKRSFPRLNLRIPVQYKRIKGRTNILRATVTKDIGAGGVKLLSNDYIPLHTKLKVDIFLTPKSESVSAVSKIVWIQKHPRSDQYDLGLQFTDIPENNRTVISGYINRNSP